MKLKWYLIIGLIIGLLAIYFPFSIKGSTYILLDNTAIEFKNHFAATVLLIAFFALWMFWLLVHYLLRTSNSTLGWLGGRSNRKARQNTIDGMIALSEGHWKTAEQLLNKSANANDTQLINYLAAAKAAQEQGQDKRRDQYLKLAAQAQPEAQVAVGLTQAQLQLQANQQEQALATLNHLRSLAPHHPYVLKLLHKLYVRLEDWQQVLTLIPKLAKNRVLDNQTIAESEINAWLNILFTASQNNLEHLQNVWSTVPKSLRKSVPLQTSYAQGLVKFSKNDSAEELVKLALKQEWDEELIALYGDIQSTNPSKQLVTAEQWLKQKSQNTTLLTCLGKISLRAQLWGKARSYLEQSLAINPSAEAYFYLAEAFERLGHPIHAQEQYQLGLLNQIERDKPGFQQTITENLFLENNSLSS